MKTLLFLSCYLFIASTLVRAADNSAIYRMTAIPMVSQARYQYDINGTRYESVSDLKKAIENLPFGSMLQWEPSDMIPAGVPSRPLSKEELSEIMAICKARNIKFVQLMHG